MLKRMDDKIGQLPFFRRLLMCIIIVMFFWCNIAVSIAGINMTVLINSAVCLLFLYLTVCWDKIKAVEGKGKKRVRNLCLVLVALLTAGYIGVSVPMAFYASHTLQDENATVIVLGCKINGDQPSLMLARRLNAAYAFLSEHPNAKCIVTGGQGADEIMPEGEAMKAYLVKKGLDEQRVFVEDQSTGTRENIAFAVKIIERENLSKNAAIATDDFHQWRARMYGERYGLACASAGSCATPWYLLPYYWTREVMGVTVTLLSLR